TLRVHQPLHPFPTRRSSDLNFLYSKNMSNHRFNRILLAVDDTPCTEKAIAYAKDLVREFGSSLAVVTVIPPTSPASYGADPLLRSEEHTSELQSRENLVCRL